MDAVVASSYGINPRKNKEELLGGFDSISGYVDLAGLKMSMTSSDIFDYSNAAYFETQPIGDMSGSYHVDYDIKDLHSLINPNLDCGAPVVMGIRAINVSNDHTILVDGYGIAS